MIQCHDRFENVARLLRWIYHPEDLFVLAIDSNSMSPRQALLPFIDHPNVCVVDHHSVTWGGASMVDIALSSLRTALQSDSWRMFINISGSDIPLCSRKRMIEIFTEYENKGYRNFVSDFGAVQFAPIISESAYAGSEKLVSAPSGARIRLFGKICELLRDGATGTAGFTPVTTPALRSSFVTIENPFNREILCRPYAPFEIDVMQNLLDGNDIRIGRQWVALSRTMCEFLLKSQVIARVYAFLRSTFIPDESFFQTAAAIAPTKDVGQTLRNNLRYALGSPENISDAIFDKITKSESIFARKVNFAESSRILEWVDQRITERV